MGNSRVEDILENMLGESHELEPPGSNLEAILQEKLGYEVTPDFPRSRVEYLTSQLDVGGGDIPTATGVSF